MPDMYEGERGSFPPTQWSVVQRAGLAGADGKAALAALVTLYLPALRSHLVVRQRFNADRADDLLQGFMTSKILEEQILTKADRGRGKFRSFLVTALDRFVIDEIRFARARKRAGAAPDADVDDLLELPSAAEGPDRAFDMEWARQVLAEAEKRMREECDRSGRPELWGVFEGRVLRPAMDGAEPVEYEALIRQYGFRSPAEASNVMITTKRAFARHLRAVVGEYAGDVAEAEAEIRDLYRIISGKRAG